MKTKILTLLVLIASVWTVNAKAQKSPAGKKVLVVYFSRSGNTRAIAEQIKSLTGGDLFEIQVTKPYPSAYRECTEVAKKEKESGARPALKTKVANMGTYDTVFIGFPNWWGTMPMPVVTFLESYDLSGKTVIPFCTHGGGGEQECFTDFVKYTGKASRKKGFLISGSQAKDAGPRVQSWLKGISMIK